MAVNIHHRYASALDADPSKLNHPRQVQGAHYSYVQPEHFNSGRLIHYNHDLGHHLSIDDEDKAYLIALFLGKEKVDTSFAMCYGGHQFGNWAGQLGDGRAINLGDIIDQSGHHRELQIKGAGPTPYSRTADGYAVLRSSIREYLCSEAMYHLGIPTTRALALMHTGQDVWRDMMYNGNPALEPGAIVCRVSESFVRFGQFEIFAARQEWDQLAALLDYCILQYHPDIVDDEMRYLIFFERVAVSTCDMVIGWMRVGFVHGVMNTDNMSILGETIDFGPYGWMDNFDLSFTPNTTDLPGRRYCYGHQPHIAQWNLVKLANAIATLVPDHIDQLKTSISDFAHRYQICHLSMMKQKLGLDIDDDNDALLISSLEQSLLESDVDMTIFYRNLSKINTTQDIIDQIVPACYQGDISPQLHTWLISYIKRLEIETQTSSIRKSRMDLVNPKYVLRNYMAQMAINAAHKEDYSMLEELYSLLQNPYDEQESMQHWFALRPSWAINKVGCSMLSCSS
jgi:serine/tyrosine/threonine adenylyltransferase